MSDNVNSIRIPVKLSLDKFKKEKKQLEDELKDLKKHTTSTETQKQIDKKNKELEKVNKTLDKQIEKQAELEKKLEKSRKKANEKVKEMGIENTLANPKAVEEAVEKELENDKGYQRAEEQQELLFEKMDAEEEKQKEITSELERQKELKEAQLEEENQAIKNKEEEIELLDEERQKFEEQIKAKKKAEQTIDGISKGLKGIVKKATKWSLAVLGVRATYAGIRKVVNSILSDNEKLSNTIDGIWAGLGSAFEPLISGLVQGFANVLNYALAIAKAITGINLIAKANQKLASKNSSSSSNLASFDKSEVLNKSSGNSTDTYLKEIELNEKLLGLVQKIKSTLASYGDAIIPSLQRMWSSFKSIFGSIAVIVLDAVNDVLIIFEPAITWIFSSLAGVFEKLAEWLSNEEIKEGLTTIATLILAVVAAITLFNVVSAVASGILALLSSPLVIIAALIAVLITCFGDWGAVIDDVQLILSGLMDFITGVFTGNWKQAWNGIVQIFAGAWNGLIDIVQSVLNGITWAINKVIDGINSLMSKIPDWVGLSNWTIDRLTPFDITGYKYIPQLANGAVLPPNKPFIAQLGDQTNGRNLEAPEDLIRQIVREESGAGGGNITLKISADSSSSEFVRWLKFKLDEESKRTGIELVEV